ncbi:unnamed protein product [Rotaria sordida]|uniref:NAD(P)(+)--arginine ADP-ribosyltransferase n=1 Tax=Rotaria sordida TaxID=392033 RepID=A0A814S3Y5_9BILA|nr:unnamed protein product [Rotaria sordida]
MTEQQINQRFICVWLDNQLIRSVEYIDTQDELRTLIKTFVTFKDSNYCVDFITNITDTKIFLITSNILGRIIVPTIHPFEQIDSIYIFHGNKPSDDQWTKDYKKIKGIFNDITLIYDRFKQDIIKEEKNNDSFAISFISSSDINSHDVNRQDPSFMYFQLLKDIILIDRLFESEEQTKADMLSYCRKVYVDCPDTILVLDEFEKDFIPELSIYWYIKECFLYKMLNKALYTPQPDVLYKLRYFLRHLYYQILSEASKQRQHLSSMTVYRGQTMSLDQIDKLKGNVGGFLSFNNFLSTSLKQDVALNFLWGSENGVLFQMEIDPKIQKFPFINIEQIPYLQREECEQELLFVMGSVFRIVRIEKEKDFYRVQLTLSGDIDEQLEEYTKVTRNQTRSFHSFLSLLRLMQKVEEYSCIDQFAEMLRDDIGVATHSMILASVHHTVFRIVRIEKEKDFYRVQLTLSGDIDEQLEEYTKVTRNQTRSFHSFLSLLRLMQKVEEYSCIDQFAEMFRDDIGVAANSTILAHVHHAFGSIYYDRGQNKEALEHFQQTLNIHMSDLPANHSVLSPTYSYIGVVYDALYDYTKALEYQQMALDCQVNSDSPDVSSIITYMKNIASVYDKQEKYSEALDYYKRALELQIGHFGENDSSVRKTYSLISSIYYKQGDYEQSTSYREKSASLQKNINELDPPSLVDSLIKDGTVCLSQKQYQQALTHFKRALEIQQQYLLPNNSSLAQTYNLIAKAFYDQEQFEEALLNYNKALEIEQNSLSDDHHSIATSYHNISTAYVGLSLWSDALDYALKAVEQSKKTLQTDVNTLAVLVHYVGYIFQEQKQYQEALIYYQEALELYQTHLSEDDPSLFIVYHRTARVYYQLDMNSEAVVLYQKTLIIALKILPDNDKQIGYVYMDLSRSFLRLKQYDESLISAEQAIEQLCKTLPNNHSEVVQYRFELSVIKQRQLSEKNFN